MHANLTEDEARVALDAIEQGSAADAFEFEKDDLPILVALTDKLSQSMMSRADSHRTHLIHQGVHPRIAAAHVRHRFGV